MGSLKVKNNGTWEYVYSNGTPTLSCNNIFNVKNYGAIGDGTTSDTVAIQSALDACNESGGGTVIFPNGTYLLSDAIKFYSNQHIVGEPKAILLQKDGNTGGVYGNLMRNYYNGAGGYDATENVVIEGLTFDGGDQEEAPSTLLAFCHSRNVQVRNCTFCNGFSNSTSSGNGHDIEVNSSYAAVIDGCTFVNNRRIGYLSELIQIDCAYGEGAYPWNSDEGNRADDETISDSVRITGCLFEGVLRDNLTERNCFVGSHSEGVHRNIIIERCSMRDSCYAVHFYNNEGLIVRDNDITNTAVAVYVDSTDTGALVINNVCSGEVQRVYPSSKVTGCGNILNGAPYEADSNLVLQSSNGTKFILSVADDGALSTTSI